MKNSDKEFVTVPVVVDYDASEGHIAGVDPSKLRTLTFGGISKTVMFTEVPAEQARAFMKLFNAEFDFDKPARRRYAAGIEEYGFEDLVIDIPDEDAVDPLQAIIDHEEEAMMDELIKYLESKHKHYGAIFQERLNGELGRREIARKLDLPKSSVRDWFDKITELAAEFYEMKNTK